jgi:hypothetical protein
VDVRQCGRLCRAALEANLAQKNAAIDTQVGNDLT